MLEVKNTAIQFRDSPIVLLSGMPMLSEAGMMLGRASEKERVGLAEDSELFWLYLNALGVPKLFWLMSFMGMPLFGDFPLHFFLIEVKLALGAAHFSLYGGIDEECFECGRVWRRILPLLHFCLYFFLDTFSEDSAFEEAGEGKERMVGGGVR